MADVTVTLPYTTKEGKELPVTFSIPENKLKRKDGKIVGGDEDYVRKAAQMALEARYPNEAGHGAPKAPLPTELTAPSSGPTFSSAGKLPDALAPGQNPVRDFIHNKVPVIGKPLMGIYDKLDSGIFGGAPGSDWKSRTADVVEGGMSIAALEGAPNIIAHPLKAAAGIVPGYLASKAIDKTGELIGADPNSTRLASDVGGIGVGAITGSPKVRGGVKSAASAAKGVIQEAPKSTAGAVLGTMAGYAAGEGTGIPSARYALAGLGGVVGGVGGKVIGSPAILGKSLVEGFKSGAAGKPLVPDMSIPNAPLQAEFANDRPFKSTPRPTDGPMYADPIYNTATGTWEPHVSSPIFESPHAAKLEAATTPFDRSYPFGLPEQMPNTAPPSPQVVGAPQIEARLPPPYMRGSETPAPANLQRVYNMPPAGTAAAEGNIPLQLTGPGESLRLPPPSQFNMPPGEQPTPPQIRGLLPAPEQWRGPGAPVPNRTIPPPEVAPTAAPTPAPVAAPVKTAPPANESPSAKTAREIVERARGKADKKEPVRPPVKGVQAAPSEPPAPREEVKLPTTVRQGWSEASMAQAEQLGDSSVYDKIDAWAKQAGKNNITPKDVRDYVAAQPKEAPAPASAAPEVQEPEITEDNWWKGREQAEQLRSTVEPEPVPPPEEKAGPTPKDVETPKAGTLQAVEDFARKRKVFTSGQVGEAFGIPVDLASRVVKELETQGKVTRSGAKWSFKEAPEPDKAPNPSQLSQVNPNENPELYVADVIGRAREGAEISHDDLYNMARALGVTPTGLARELIGKGFKVQESKFPGKYGLTTKGKLPDEIQAAVDAIVKKHAKPPQ